MYPLVNHADKYNWSNYKFEDGTSYYLPMSGQLKCWIEGGYKDIHSWNAPNYSINPITGKNMMEVEPVSEENFRNNPEMIWNYDIVMFGTYYGEKGAMHFEKEQLDIIEKYIQSGYGVLAGKDTIANINGKNTDLASLRKYFNIVVGGNASNNSSVETEDQIYYSDKTWEYTGTQLKKNLDGIIFNMPNEINILEDEKISLDDRSRKTNSQAALGNVWAMLDNGSYSNNSAGEGEYNGNGQFFLTTWNNTAVTQLGDDGENQDTSDAERKILANTLCYLKQVTNKTRFKSYNTNIDYVPPKLTKVEIGANLKASKIQITLEAEDFGGKYSYQIKAYDEKNPEICIDESNIIESIESCSGVQGYYYIVDSNSENIDFNINNATYTADNKIYLNLDNEGKYVHIKAVDNNKNTSEPVVKYINTKLELDSKLNTEIDENNKINYNIKLDWQNYVNDEHIFEVYKKDGEKDWELYTENKITEKIFIDNMVKDKEAPRAPSISIALNQESGKYEVKHHNNDLGSKYEYYLKAYSKDNTEESIISSNIRTETVLSGIKGIYYIISNNKKLTDFDITKAKYTESNSFEIDITEKDKYLYMKLEDNAGNLSDMTVAIISDTIELRTSVNLNAANKKGGVDLEWEMNDPKNKIFKVYQKKENSEIWETISTFDFDSEVEPIKVLNVYPEAGEMDIPNVTFRYLDGTTKILPKSASLKVWMEGGSRTENDTTIYYEPYGKNPKTGQQLINVTLVDTEHFNEEPEMIWNYDVVMFGTWDSNGRQSPDIDAIKVVEQYIKEGNGILTGHDTLSTLPEFVDTFCTLRNYFNIELGWIGDEETDSKYHDIEANWGHSSETVKVERNGMLTNFPWELPLGAELTVPKTHTISNAAHGNVWMDFINGDKMAYGDIQNYYNAGGNGDASYYLTTWNNTAMIQTGHSNCNSTADERMVLANTLFYLKQKTGNTSSIDNSAQDMKAPDAPIIDARNILEDKTKISFNAKDNGSKYEYYVEAFDIKNQVNVVATSNKREEIVTTGTKGYYYIIDNNSENIDFQISKETLYTEDETLDLDFSAGQYIHIKAIDVAGNIGPTSVAYIGKQYVDIKVTKIWDDDNNKAGKRPESIDLELYYIKNTVEDSQEVVIQTGKLENLLKTKESLENLEDLETSEILESTDNSNIENEFEYVFENLPRFDDEGNEISYLVRESNKKELLYAASIGEMTKESETENKIVYTVTITNSFGVENVKLDIMVDKQWNDNNNENGKRPDSINLTLMSGKKELETKTISEKEAWKTTFENYPKYDDTLTEIKYTIKEVEVKENDLKFYEGEKEVLVQKTYEIIVNPTTGETHRIYKATIVNTFTVPNTENVIEVTKIWDDDNDKNKDRPNKIILTLTAQEDENIKYTKIVEKPLKSDTPNEWKCEFIVPAYNENGDELTYLLGEEELKEYIMTSNENSITNSLIIRELEITKSGTSEINSIDQNIDYVIDYNAIIDKRYKDDLRIEIIDTLPYPIDTKVSNLNGGTYNYEEDTYPTITWLGTYNFETNSITWSNGESQILESSTETLDNIKTNTINLQKSISVRYKNIGVNNNGEIISNEVEGNLILKNNITETSNSTWTTKIDFKKQIAVVKEWNGDRIQDEQGQIVIKGRPKEISVNLNKTLNGATEIVDTKILTNIDDWTYFWDNLPKYNEESGQEIQYSVTENEESILGYYLDKIIKEEKDNVTTYKLTNNKFASIVVEKTDTKNDDLKLAGAEFKLEKLIQDETGKWIVPDNTSEQYVSYEGVTDENGIYTFDNLKYGTYKLTETKAPENYKISEKDIPNIVINEENRDVKIIVTNTKTYKLPITGGIGIDITKSAGFLLVTILVILISNRRNVIPVRRKKNIKTKPVKRSKTR